MHAKLEISKEQARKIVLCSQGLNKNTGCGNDVRQVVEKLGYVQIDTISVVERAHNHVFWSRLPNYQPVDLQASHHLKQVFEYWSHAAAYLPMRDFRYSLPRKQAIKNGEKHWYRIEEKVLKEVLAKVQSEGPIRSKDFSAKDKIVTAWGETKLAKRALEHLFMRGDLMIAERVNFQKVYDLTERVLPSEVDTSMPSDEELWRHLIVSCLGAHGVATPAQIGYLRKGARSKIENICKWMQENGELINVSIAGQDYYANSTVTELLATRISRRRVRILSPFDNMVIQRNRLKEIFDFEYQIECYVPERKRKHGYFVLPLLWGSEFAGRMDAKIDRGEGILFIKKLWIETVQRDDFMECLKPALEEFCAFNGGQTYLIEQIISD